jgi:hypothetical protein
VQAFTIETVHLSKCGVAQPKCPFEDRVEYRSKVTGRRIDSPNDFSHCGLLSRVLIPLGKGLFEPPLQLSIGPPKIHLAIEGRGHLRLPVRPAPDEWYLIGTRLAEKECATRSSSGRERQVRR